AGRAGAVLAAAAASLVARAAAVYLLLGVPRLFGGGVSLRWQHLIVWSGLRGAIAVALALSLSEQGGQFEGLRALVYGVVLVSILVQGATVGRLARLLLGDARGDGPPLPEPPLSPGS